MHDKRTLGTKTYHSSHNILRPMQVASGNEAISAILSEHVIPDVNPLTHREYESEWLGKVDYKQYEISYVRKRPESDDSKSHAQRGDREEW